MRGVDSIVGFGVERIFGLGFRVFLKDSVFNSTWFSVQDLRRVQWFCWFQGFGVRGFGFRPYGF